MRPIQLRMARSLTQSKKSSITVYILHRLPPETDISELLLGYSDSLISYPDSDNDPYFDWKGQPLLESTELQILTTRLMIAATVCDRSRKQSAGLFKESRLVLSSNGNYGKSLFLTAQLYRVWISLLMSFPKVCFSKFTRAKCHYFQRSNWPGSTENCFPYFQPYNIRKRVDPTTLPSRLC